MSDEKKFTSKLDFDISPQSIFDEMKKHSESIDFSQFEKEGLIEKKGDWYKVNNLSKLPESLSSRIDQIKQSKGTVLVKFSNPAQYRKLVKKYEKMGFK